MKTVILCGGQGTRIREASEALPKPMLAIGGRPILWHVMKIYATQGFRDFVLCLGYRAWVVKEFFLNYRAMNNDLTVRLSRQADVTMHEESSAEEDWSVTMAETGERTMTGGRIVAIRRYLQHDDLFMLTYGDGVADVDVNRLLAFHRSHGRVATVTAVRPPGRFGELRIEQGMVSEFNEKPQTTEGFINGGFFVIDAQRIWPYLPARSDLVFEEEPLRKLAADGQLAAFPHEGFWQPMDTLRELNLLDALWHTQRAPWKIW